MKKCSDCLNKNISNDLMRISNALRNKIKFKNTKWNLSFNWKIHQNSY